MTASKTSANFHDPSAIALEITEDPRSRLALFAEIAADLKLELRD